MKKILSVRFYSSVLSANAILITSFTPIAGKAQELRAIIQNEPYQIYCIHDGPANLSCDNQSTYKLLTNKLQIKMAEEELLNSEAKKLIISIFDDAEKEIKDFFKFLNDQEKGIVYQEPSLKFGHLTETEENEFKSELKYIFKFIEKDKNYTPHSLLQDPKISEGIKDKELFKIITSADRRGKIDPRSPAYYAGAAVVCGVVVMKADAKAGGKASEKASSMLKSGASNNSDLFKEKRDSQVDEILKKYIIERPNEC